VHRDVTPANVMLTSTGAKVVDFGISALVGQRDSAPDGSLLGTPAYLAPERLSGGQVSPSTDVYALGLLLYRALTGRLPWPAENTTEALRAHLYADPEPLPSIAGLPAEAAELCLRCLEKHPSDRPGAAEIARSLGALVGVQPVISPLDSAFAGDGPLRSPGAARSTEPIPIGQRPPASRAPHRLLDRLGLPASGSPRSLLDRLGLPAVSRLRAGLRIGAALHLGAVRPLGGGLFTPRLPTPLFAGRHRLQAAAATISLLVAVGVSWSTTRAPAETVPAQASAVGVGVGPVLPRATGCKVRYQVRQDDGEDFEALLSVLNTGERSIERWRLNFTFPGTQRLVNLPRTIDQTGRRVHLRAAGSGQLRPGQVVAVTLRGAYRDINPLPLAFALNGHSCDVEILGPTTITPSTAADESADSQVGTTRSKKSGERPRHSSVRHHRHQKHHSKPRPVLRTPRKAPTPEPIGKAGGFSMAV
jgi:serine/threonine-protein kinase